MGTWFTCHLGDALLAEAELARIQSRFRSQGGQSASPEETAVFVRYESEGRLHCEVRVYFSPAAAALAEELKAMPCQRPDTDGLSLLAGPEGAWAVLFPDTRQGPG